MTKSICIVLALAIAGCGSKGGGGALGKDAVKTFMKSLREQDPPNKKTEDVVKAATDKFGQPTRTDGKKTIWSYKDGDDCRQFFVEDMGGAASYGDEGASCPK